MAETPDGLPSLDHLFRTNLVDQVLDLVLGGGNGYSDPIPFQLTTAARLLDKALNDWDLTLNEFELHHETRGSVPPGPLQAPKPGVTRAYFRAIDHLETLVDSLARLFRLVRSLEGALTFPPLTEMQLPSEAERKRVRDFRNRIAHGDEDIAEGKGGKGNPTATLRITETAIELQTERLEFSELARMMEEVHDYLRAASQHDPP